MPQPSKAVVGGLWLASAALLLLGAVATTFVGDEIGNDGGFDLGPEVGAAAVRAGDASVRYQVTVGGDPGGTGPVAQRVLLVTDLGTGRSRFDAQLDVAPLALRLRGVAAEEAVFLESPADRDLPGGASWIGVARDGVAAGRVSFATGEAYLDTFGTDRSRAGEEVVEGRPTERWRLTVAPDRVVSHPVEAVLGGLFLGGTPQQDHEVWLDRDGLPRRHRVVSSARGEPVVVDTSFSYHRPFRVELPDGAEVHEAGDVQEVLVLLGGATTPTRPALGATSEAADEAAQAELRQGLAIEKVYFTDHRRYSADRIELDAMPAAVEMAVSADGQVVCLTRRSASGAVFVLADIATGAGQGTRYGRAPLTACTRETVAALAPSW